MSGLRFLTAGESHGEELLGILEGMPAGLSLVASRDIDPMLAERQKGYGRSRRQLIEQDTARIISGVRLGLTTGAPIAIKIANRDWANWSDRMSVIPNQASEEKHVTVPRPGHADFAGGIKYEQTSDLRNILERASARETAMRVAIGAIAARLLAELEMQSISFVESIGSVVAELPNEALLFDLRESIKQSPVRTPDESAAGLMVAQIDLAKSEGDTLGGVVRCVVRGMPVGVGSHVHWDRKLDGMLAHAVMSIQAVKGVEIGEGFASATSRGSQVHDELTLQDGMIRRTSNHAGGIEGGMSNGESIVVRAAMKPISTLMRPLHSIDLSTGIAVDAHIERSDVCAVPALAIIVEAVVCMTLASTVLETYGGDTMDELKRRVVDRKKKFQFTKQPNLQK